MDSPTHEAGLRRLVGDLAVALVAFAGSAWVLFASSEAAARAADAIGVGLLLAAAAPLVVRRRWPVAVLLAVVAVTAAVLALDYPGGVELPLILVALYTVMAEGHRRAGLGVLGLLVAVSAGYRLLVDRDDPLLVVVTVSLLILVVALGDGSRVRRELRIQMRERLRMIEAERELETRVELTRERLRIARELHDVLAHTVTAISVQAGASADGLTAGSQAHDALRSMRATAQEAMQQLRATIELLRSESVPSSPRVAPDLSALDELAEGARKAGLAVEVTTDGPVHELTAAVQLTAFRIVQEALTNVLRHADAERVWVGLTRSTGALTVSVADDGTGRRQEAGGGRGFGIVGMRERAQALGGRLEADDAVAGGFQVRAVLPTGEQGA